MRVVGLILGRDVRKSKAAVTTRMRVEGLIFIRCVTVSKSKAAVTVMFPYMYIYIYIYYDT